MAQLKFSGSLEVSDPRKQPVAIIGQLEHLKCVPFGIVKPKLQERVSEEVKKTCIVYATKQIQCMVHRSDLFVFAFTDFYVRR